MFRINSKDIVFARNAFLSAVVLGSIQFCHESRKISDEKICPDGPSSNRISLAPLETIVIPQGSAVLNLHRGGIGDPILSVSLTDNVSRQKIAGGQFNISRDPANLVVLSDINRGTKDQRTTNFGTGEYDGSCFVIKLAQ